MSTIRSIVDDFAKRLNTIIEEQVVSRARDAVAAALGGARGKRGPGRPPKLVSLALASAPVALGKRRRKKAPPQLCPVPGCKNRAAPIFGMVCSDHKNVPKAKIRQYREARRAKKNRQATRRAGKK